ncbi:MAG TPA: flagellar hook-associated protein FlgK [Acidobacteriaceae bacterium]|jgi:flagellar hook-associated protein 1 FlgK
MGGLSQAFGIVQGALLADQQAIDVTANNVGNANTPGYTREIVNWQQNDPVTIDGRQLGTGSSIGSVSSQRDLILNQAIDQQQQSLSAAQSRLNGLTAVENIFNQVTTANSSSGTGGIGGALSNFFGSLSSLEASPSNNSVRATVLSAAQSLAGSFNSAASQLTGDTNSLNLRVTTSVQQINGLTKTLASLNQEISTTTPTGDAGTLEDQRQQALSQLSQLIDVNQIQTSNNGLTLTTANGTVLVSGNKSYALSTSLSSTGAEAVLSGGQDISTSIQGGSLGGTLTNLYQDIPAVQSQIDTLAYQVASSVNAVQVAGADENGAAGVALFKLPATATGAAATISVAITDPAKIAAAAVGNGPGDSSNAQTMAALANKAIVGGATPSGSYAAFLAGLGSNVQSLTTQVSSVTASLAQLTTQQGSLSGVSQNQEAMNLQTYERSYQAASQTFNILNTLMGVALNLGVQSAMA